MTPQGNRHTFSKNDLIDKIINMRIKEGFTRLDIFAYLTKELEQAPTTAYEYMKWAREETDRRAVQNFGEDLKEDIERFEDLHRQALADGDKREARELLKEIGKLKGHYIERTDITSGNEPIINITLKHIKGNKSDDLDIDDIFKDI